MSYEFLIENIHSMRPLDKKCTLADTVCYQGAFFRVHSAKQRFEQQLAVLFQIRNQRCADTGNHCIGVGTGGGNPQGLHIPFHCRYILYPVLCCQYQLYPYQLMNRFQELYYQEYSESVMIRPHLSITLKFCTFFKRD